MNFEKEALKKQWWFVGPIAFGSVFSLSWVLRAAGLSTDLDSLISPMALVHCLILGGLWFFYSEFLAFLVLRVWPALVKHMAPVKDQ